MSELEQLRARLEALQAEVAMLREDAAATRTMAAMADRDVAGYRTELRAHTQVLQALRETQLERQNVLRGIADAVGALAAGQQAILNRLAEN